jgi:branched-chain amino acid transport system ATP-binding protein
LGVRAAYGRIEVLHGIDLTVPRGTVFALLGRNGAGKTTTLKVCSGAMSPMSGCVHVAGVHVNGRSPDAFARAGLCRIPEGRGVFPNLTVHDNIRMTTYSSELSLRDITDRVYTQFPRLRERRQQLAGRLSGGEQQMLAMARALVADPAVLMLDEISMGLAPQIVTSLYATVSSLAASGITILLVEQFAHAALEIADYAAVMNQGAIAAIGQPADVASYVSDAYLGESA